MLHIVLTIGALNMAMGYALAVFLKRALDDADAATETVATSVPPAPMNTDLADEAKEEDLLADVETVELIPAQWVAHLEAESVQAQSFVEATAQIMRLEVGKYREALVRLEDETRREGLTPARLQSVVDRLVKLNGHWLKVQAQAYELLAARVDTLTEFAEVGGRLDQILRQQQVQIQSTCGCLQACDCEADIAGSDRIVAGEFCVLLNLAHQLRDDVSEALLATLRADERLDELDKSIRGDAATGLFSRAGMEIAVAHWWNTDPARNRLASAVLLDVVGTEAFNRSMGTRVGDRILAAAGSLLDEMMRKERGFDFAARIDGQRFLFFLGDTGPRHATSGAERFRQAMDAAAFECGVEEFQLHVTSAVTEVRKDDDITSLLSRLDATLVAAKEAGRNCTMLDEGAGPHPVEPPAYQVPARVVQIEAD